MLKRDGIVGCHCTGNVNSSADTRDALPKRVRPVPARSHLHKRFEYSPPHLLSRKYALSPPLSPTTDDTAARVCLWLEFEPYIAPTEHTLSTKPTARSSPHPLSPTILLAERCRCLDVMNGSCCRRRRSAGNLPAGETVQEYFGLWYG